MYIFRFLGGFQKALNNFDILMHIYVDFNKIVQTSFIIFLFFMSKLYYIELYKDYKAEIFKELKRGIYLEQD